MSDVSRELRYIVEVSRIGEVLAGRTVVFAITKCEADWLVVGKHCKMPSLQHVAEVLYAFIDS